MLANHEIGVHMVTTMNGVLHPLKIFSHGFPGNEETQEGLAVFSEYMSGNLTIKRLKELAYRVLAVDSLAKGYSFSKTFRMLHNSYDLEREQAFYISVRAHRGGGFTKDYLYLSGLKKIYDYHQSGKNLNLLITGKVSLEFLDTISYMIQNKYAIPAKHLTNSFFVNNNANKNVLYGRMLSIILHSNFELLKFGHLQHHLYNRSKYDLTEGYDPLLKKQKNNLAQTNFIFIYINDHFLYI